MFIDCEITNFGYMKRYVLMTNMTYIILLNLIKDNEMRWLANRYPQGDASFNINKKKGTMTQYSIDHVFY